jgi:hypothetical protein
MKINKLYLNGLLGLVGLGVVYFMASFVVPKMLVTLTKAAPASVVSLSKSYFIGGKMLAKADGKDSCVVNVFALDATGKGVKEKSIELTGMGTEVLSEITNTDGMASFKVSSATEGQYKLTATIDGVPVGRELTVTF